MTQISITVAAASVAMMFFAAQSHALPPCPADLTDLGGEPFWNHNCFGEHTYASGNKLVGEFKHGKLHGKGTLEWANGDKYVGEFHDGELNGQGTFVRANGDKYVGEFKNDRFHGKGTYTYANGETYTGDHLAHERHGVGTYTFSDGGSYVGEFKNNKFHGQGTGTMANGDQYVGEYQDGSRNGYGVLTYADGRIDEGIWKDHALSDENVALSTNTPYIIEFNVMEAARNNSDSSCTLHPEQPCSSWKYDITRDGALELLSCGYWSRWEVLIDCEIKNPSTNQVFQLYPAAGTASAQCKKISVLAEIENGVYQLACDSTKVDLKPINAEDSLYFRPQDSDLLGSKTNQGGDISVDNNRAMQEAKLTVDIYSNMHNVHDRMFVQQLLLRKGCYMGLIDGTWGTPTQDALRDLYVSLQYLNIPYSVNSFEDFQSTILSVRDYPGELCMPFDAYTSSEQQQSSAEESGVKPSFDCANALTEDEVTICANDHLAELDTQVSEAYSMLQEVMGPDLAKDFADGALSERRKCKADVNCIEKVQIWSIENFNRVLSQE